MHEATARVKNVFLIVYSSIISERKKFSLGDSRTGYFHPMGDAFVPRFVILSEAKNLCVWRVSQRRFFASLRMTPSEIFAPT
jgi:hypothetical protein